MKKLRIVILSLSTFSLFYSVFWYIYAAIYNNKNSGINFLSSVKKPFSTNIFTILFLFLCILAWYIYQRKVRLESVSNFIIFMLLLVYVILFIIGLANISNMEKNIWREYSYAITISSNFWLVISFIPALLHFIASICTGGYDNVGEPYNIYGFIYTIIGLCYIPCILAFGLLGRFNQFSPLYEVYDFLDNGLIYTFVILTFILCAGLRFNMVVIDILNIIFEFAFVIWWIVIITSYNDVTYRYLCSLNLIMAIPLFVLSIFILHHYICYDRFYKGQTKNFLDD